MWWRVAVAGIAVGLVAIIGTNRAPDRPTQVDRPVAIATMPCSPSLQTTSSGFLIEEGIVITVAHAIYESREFAIQDSTGEWHRATVQHMDLERDLAVLAVDNLAVSPMQLVTAVAGDSVRMLNGAASGVVDGEILRQVRITTEVIGDLDQKSQRSGYELSVDILGGDSGAAIVDDDENLVGVVFARSTRRDASWATSASEVQEIRDRSGGPEWECERDSDVPLVLDAPEPRLRP